MPPIQLTRIEDKFELIIAGNEGEMISARRHKRISVRPGSLLMRLMPWFCTNHQRGYFFEPLANVASIWLTSQCGTGSTLNSFIGAHSYVNDGGIIRDHTLIGRYCSIGRRVSIAAGDHSMSHLSTSPALQSRHLLYSHATKWTVIHSDCWIGDGAIIRAGVTIGPGSVIGANSVVTRSVPPYTVAAGSPCRPIRQRLADRFAARLQETQWWNLRHSVIKATLSKQLDLEATIAMLELEKSSSPHFCADYETLYL
jgi:acetyltransferase-like isoleucine patch superfamily enzyme